MHRLAAALVAAAAWAGLAVQFAANLETQSALDAVWILLRFFTIITNLLVALTMTGVAAGRRVSPFILAGLTLAILFVGAIYMTLLHGIVQLVGLGNLADTLLHYVVPVAMGIYWLAFAPKIGLTWRDPLLWCVYPILYLAYVVVRGSVDGRYPYPFIDVASLGYGRTLLNSLMLMAAYLVAGLALVALGRGLARRRGARGPLGQRLPNG
jgi:hypothetical protein